MKKIIATAMLLLLVAAALFAGAKEEAIQSLDNAKIMLGRDNFAAAQNEIDYAQTKIAEIEPSTNEPLPIPEPEPVKPTPQPPEPDPITPAPLKESEKEKPSKNAEKAAPAKEPKSWMRSHITERLAASSSSHNLAET